MKKMIAILSTAATLALPAVALSVDGGGAPGQEAGEGKVVAEAMVATNATVQAIDKKKRTITLLMPDGRTEAFVVDKSVKKFGKVKVGDTVKIRYNEAVTVKLNKVKVPPAVKVEGSVTPNPKSEKPAGTSTVKVTTTATIEKVYPYGKKVTLRFADDTVGDVEVRDPENQAKLRNGEVKEGDQIEITYRRAMAISVEKAEK